MPHLIGVDEAGLGPNLGPLVVTATVWEVPDTACDPLVALADVLSPTPAPGRLCVADSKALYSPATGPAELERTARAALGVVGVDAGDLRGLVDGVTPRGGGFQPPRRPGPAGSRSSEEPEPWFAGPGCGLPLTAGQEVGEEIRRWRAAGERTGVRLVAVRSDVVFTPRFNRLLADRGGKGGLLTGVSLALLRAAWESVDPARDAPAHVVCDRHGGRKRYAGPLADAFDALPSMTHERPDSSLYALDRSTVEFRTRSESFAPVGLASVVSKYVREAAMRTFNRWWTDAAPHARPTAGYPTDAARFRDETAAVRAERGIDDAVFWRSR